MLQMVVLPGTCWISGLEANKLLVRYINYLFLFLLLFVFRIYQGVFLASSLLFFVYLFFKYSEFDFPVYHLPTSGRLHIVEAVPNDEAQ